MTRSLSETLAGGSPVTWAVDFLNAARFPVTANNVQVVYSWEYAESSGGGGMWNPLNTTQGGYPGETDFNSVGVKNYARRADGVAANAKVIHNGYYRDAVRAFELSASPQLTVNAITRSPWGTRHIALRAVPGAPPAPEVHDMQIVAGPHKPTIPGRTPAARWDAGHPNRVLLTNGQGIRFDQSIGNDRREWKPPVPAGCTGIGIAPTVDSKGRPDGRGIVLQDDHDDTYVGLWS